MAGQLRQARLRRPARQADGRHEAVRHVLLLDVVQVQPCARGAVQVEAQRGRQAPALVLHVVATGHVAVLPHRVEAQRQAAGQRLAPVGRAAALIIGAAGERAGDRIVQGGALADHVDRAGRRAAAVVGARRSFLDLDLIDVEHIARNRTQVAHAVDEDAAGAVEAAHVDGVAGVGAAVFAGIERAHAGRVAQRLGQGGGALLVEQVAGDHLDGLRRVLQRLGELGRGHGLGLDTRAVHIDLVQGARVAAVMTLAIVLVPVVVALLVGGRARRVDPVGRQGGARQGQRQRGGQGGGGQRAGARKVLAGTDVRHVSGASNEVKIGSPIGDG